MSPHVPTAFQRVVKTAVAILGVTAVQACEPTHSDMDIVSAVGTSEPMLLRATFTAGGLYSNRVRRISWKKPRKDRKPIVLVVAGCAFSVAGAEFGPDAIQLSVDDGETGPAGSMGEACREQDAAALNAAVTRQIDFMVRNLSVIEIGDPARVLLYGSGEAVPAVMAYRGSFAGRMLLGGPCFTGWPSTFETRGNMVLVWPSDGAGAGWGERPVDFTRGDLEGSEVAVRKNVEKVGRISRSTCQPQIPAGLPSNIEVLHSTGQLGWLSRSAELEADERAAYELLMP